MRTIRAGLAGVLAGAMTLVALGGVAAAGASAATTVEAHGSVEQVYATGLEPGAAMKLVTQGQARSRRSAANAEGGLLFRQGQAGRRLPRQAGGGGEARRS